MARSQQRDELVLAVRLGEEALELVRVRQRRVHAERSSADRAAVSARGNDAAMRARGRFSGARANVNNDPSAALYFQLASSQAREILPHPRRQTGREDFFARPAQANRHRQIV